MQRASGRAAITSTILSVLFLGVFANVAGGAPITSITLINNFRETRALNDVGIAQGDLNQFGADVVPPGPATTLSATQGAISVAASPCIGLAVDSNFCARSVPFSAGLLGGAWTLTFANGPDSRMAITPVLDPAAVTPVPFPNNVTISGSGFTPTLSWTVPAGFTPDQTRVNIFDKSQFRPGSTTAADIVHSVTLPGSATGFTVPAVLTVGGPLKPGNPYVLNLQLIESRGGGPVVGNFNIARRSSSFFDFTPLTGGAPLKVLLPTVGPDPNPNDAFGAPYQFRFSITDQQVRFIDPLFAIGYDYAIGAGDPNFASVIFPEVGDGLFELSFGSTTQTVAAGVQVFFPAGGVNQFSVRGIETSAGLDPGDVTAFITGLTWVGLGEFTGTMTPLVQFVPEVNGVPFPGSLVLLGVGLVVLAWTTRRSWLS